MAVIYFTIEDPQWESVLPDHEKLAEKVLKSEEGELSIVLADDAFVRRLNAQFRDKDSPTNILSFASEDEPGYLGDLILARETIFREAKEQHKEPEAHFMHLLIHGYLHLCGYDHEEEQQAQKMEAKEIKWLAQLGIANPYEIQ